MRKIVQKSLIVGVLVYLAAFQSCSEFSETKKNELIIYPAPEEEILSEDYTLEVNGQPVDIYLAKIADVENPDSWLIWTIPIYNSDSVSITNIKLVCSKNPNDDGINPCNSRRVYIRDCFIRTDDDCIAMKGIRRGSDNDNVEYITVENCLLWADRARVFLLGHESRAEYMRHIVLRDLDILHFNMTPFLLEPGEEMSIEDVQVENVTAYADYPSQGGERSFNLICLRPVINQYMHNKVPGKISNVQFKNIALTGEEREGKYTVWVKGADPEHKVTNVTFDGVSWFNHLLDEHSPQVKIEDNTSNIHFVN